MGRQKRYILEYYHTGRYQDLTDYKRRKIQKEILQMGSRLEQDIDIQDGSSASSSSRLLESTFDETGISTQPNLLLSSPREKIEAKVGDSCTSTFLSAVSFL